MSTFRIGERGVRRLRVSGPWVAPPRACRGRRRTRVLDEGMHDDAHGLRMRVRGVHHTVVRVRGPSRPSARRSSHRSRRGCRPTGVLAPSASTLASWRCAASSRSSRAMRRRISITCADARGNTYTVTAMDTEKRKPIQPTNGCPQKRCPRYGTNILLISDKRCWICAIFPKKPRIFENNVPTVSKRWTRCSRAWRFR